ncbi:MAG: synthase subunit [Bacteroidetes bacterium]|nr:synthase subunit [Bacteroidota bacterium]
MQVLRCFLGGLLLMGLSLHSLGAIETQPAHENAALPGEKESAENHEGTAKEKFEPGTFIFDHIGNAHEWHIITIGQTHVTIPLPVILYSKSKGLDIFMSGKFHHGHETYKGYTLETEGEKKGKIVAEDGSLPLDLSITKNVAALFFGIFLILWIFLTVAKAYKRNPLKPPSGLQAFIEPVIFFMRDEVIKPSIGEKHYEKYMPYLLTLFFFIFINNLLGLIPIPPGGANLTGNISVTFVLALFTFIITTVNGTRNYWKHIFNTPGVPLWLKIPIPLMPLVEFLGVFTKPFVLMIRLFANITGGHIIIMGFVCLIYVFSEMSAGLAYGVSIVSISFNIFMTFIELLVAFLQAFIFTFLSSLYFGMAIEEEHH